MDNATNDSADTGDERAATDPLRTCVVTRREATPDSLIRFVAGPDGTVVPDLACRLPGRGVWVSLDRATVEKAVAIKAFSRGLKREVKAAPDLAAVVDTLLAGRALDALSLANKSGLVRTGFTKIDAEITSGHILALFHGIGAGADGVEKLDRRYQAMCRDLVRPPQILWCFTIEQMSLALGRSNVVHAALMKGGAAQHLLVQAERLQKYRTGKLPVEPSSDGRCSAATPDMTRQGKA